MKKAKEELNNLKGKKTYNRLSSLSKSKVEEFATFLNIKYNEAIFLILNDMNEPQRCKCCDNFTSLVRGPLRYREFCSVSCKNKWMYENTDIAQRISNTVKKYAKFAKETGLKYKQINKKLKTQINNGSIMNPAAKSDFEKYKLLVRKITDRQELCELENIEKRGRIDLRADCYHLDHKYSIKEGFKNYIPPYIIGSIYNLAMIPHRENCSKQDKCSLSLNELIRIFYGNY